MKAFIRYYSIDYIRLFISKFRFWISNKTAVVIYSMGKVGSMSVYSSIKKQTAIPCFHLHTLNTEEERKTEQICFENELIPDSRSTLFFLERKLLKPQRKVKLITQFRSPIERNISAFFDAFELYVGIPAERYEGNVETLIQIYHDKLPHSYAIDWFDQKFKRDTGIDVYDHDFNKEIGFKQISKDNFTVLLLNSAINNSKKEEQIGKFIHEESFVLRDVNITSATSNSKLYNEFKNTIKFNKQDLDTLLQSKYTQHFFTKAEIASSYKRWLA